MAPLLRLAIDALASSRREAAIALEHSLLFRIAAAIAGAAALGCFSACALLLLEPHMTPAEAWALLGIFYAAAGGVFYRLAMRHR